MRRDGDRLTRAELKAAMATLKGKAVDDRSALQRLRRRSPPTPEDAVYWAVGEAIVLEERLRIWPEEPPSTEGMGFVEQLDAFAQWMRMRRPRVLEDAILAYVDALVDRGMSRFLTFLHQRLRPHLGELERLAKEALPQLGIPPEVSPVIEGERLRLDAGILYACLRGRTRGEGPARNVEEFLFRAQGEGCEEREALYHLRIFRDQGLLLRFTWPPVLDTSLELAERRG